MTSYTTVDEVTARFPKFARSGALQPIVSAARSAGIATVTFAGNHGAQPGWSIVVAGATGAAATVFDGTFTVAAATATSLSYLQAGADDTAASGTASLAPAGKVSDGQIQTWIDECAAYITALAVARGYQLDALPAATEDQANVMLRNLVKMRAQVLVGEAYVMGMGLTGQWQVLDNIRSEFSDLVKSFRAGAYDKLFVANAATQDVGPQMGGFVPCRPIFRREGRF